jgi:hypothetical protein
MKNFANNLTNRYLNCVFFVLLLLTNLTAFSQNVGINSTGTAPNTSAGLDVDFPDKGVLIPRVALTSTTSFAPLAAHVAGMVVYNTATIGNVTPGFYYNNGTLWVPAFPSGTAIGDMLYWDGSGWVNVPAGTPGQYLQLNGSQIPYWASGAANAAIVTTAASLVTGITATTGGNITADGGLSVLSRGVCYATTANPTTANSVLVASPATGIGVFTSNLTGLSPMTTYYVRAYATNSAVTSYGNQISFTTTAVLPILAATTTATSITTTTAVTGGNITSDGGATVTERGICYALTANPTTANTKIIDPGTGPGSFVSNMTGLTGYTTYYVRSYAISSIGTAYGAQITFRTLTSPPTLNTVAATSIGTTTAISGASMSWNGGGYSNYQNYGVAYATTPNSATPTLVATNTANGSVNPAVNINPWVTNLTGLTPNTTYYIRAYISLYLAGTGPWVTVYGNELSFTTTSISTAATGAVTLTSIVSGGSIAANVATVTARGVCWNTSTGPTIANSITSDGTGNGTFVSNITGLTGGTTYYFRAYYTDGGGNTFYGNEMSATTGAPKAIGDNLAGGKVIYVDATGQHGLIGALVDQGTAVPWGCYGVVTNATGTALYTGLANTNLIVAACGAGTAAQLCASYTAGGTGLTGITNWYLPSKDEFQLVLAQKTLIGLTTSCGANGCMYWTSTEYNSAIAYLIPSILVSPSYNNYKNTANYVRAIRAF